MRTLLIIALLAAPVPLPRVQWDQPNVMARAGFWRPPVTCNGTNAATLQTCISNAVGGDTILVTAGATINVNGSFQFPNRSVSDTTDVLVTTSGTIPTQFATTWPNSYTNGAFTRLNPSLATNMPKLVGVDALGVPVLRFLAGSHHWKIQGMEVRNNGTVLTTTLVSTDDENVHHITLDQNYLHPFEEVGDLTTNIAVRTTESALAINGHHWTVTRNCVQGFTGHAPAANGGDRLNANSILISYLADSLIENNLLEANGQIFFSGGGGTDPAHVATATNISFTQATFSSTTDLDVGDYFAIYSQAIGDNHRLPHTSTPGLIVDSVGHYVTGQVTAVNHSTNVVNYDNLNASIGYRSVDLNLWGATAGTYTLTFMGQTTTALAFDATFAQIQTALENLSNIVPGEILVGPGIYGPVNIRIGVDASGRPFGQWAYPTKLTYSAEFGAPITINYSNLSGGIRTASATIKSSESYHPVEGSVANALADAPVNGASVRWEGVQSHNNIIRKNIIAHHPEWTAVTGSVKGFVEVKGCDHLTFDANIFSGEGTTIINTVRNQGDGGSSPWSSVSYQTVTNNLFDVTGYADAIILEDGAQQNTPSHDMLVSNNLFLNPDYEHPNPWVKVQAGYNVTITHNTVFAQGLVFGYSPQPSSGLVIKDNILRPYGYTSPCTDGPGPCYPAATSGNNLLLNNKGLNPTQITEWFNNFPGGWSETSASAIFTAPDTNLDPDGVESKFSLPGNYRVKAGSPYKAGGARQASDGKDVGLDYVAFVAAFGGFDPTDPGDNPIINAGADQSLSAGTTSTTLTATVTDPNGLSTTKLWTRISGPNTPTIVSSTALSTSVTGMTNGTYVFRMTATNATPLSGSDDVQVAIGAVSAPSAPSNLIATTVSSTQINLAWTPATGQTSYKLERCAGLSCSNFSQVATPAVDNLSYQNTGLAVSTLYSYRLRATNIGGDSAYSNTSTAQTQDIPVDITVCRWSTSVRCATQAPALMQFIFCADCSVDHTPIWKECPGCRPE